MPGPSFSKEFLDRIAHQNPSLHLIGPDLAPPTVVLPLASVDSLGVSPYVAREDHRHSIPAAFITNDKLSTTVGEVGGPWIAYTPTLGGTGWALGTTGASAVGWWTQWGKNVAFYTRLIFGTVGATFGAGRPNITLPPVTGRADSTLNAAIALAEATIGASTWQLVPRMLAGKTSMDLWVWRCVTAGAATGFLDLASVTSAVPGTWAANSTIWFRGLLEIT